MDINLKELAKEWDTTEEKLLETIALVQYMRAKATGEQQVVILATSKGG